MHFDLDVLDRELGLIKELAEPFLEPDSARALEQARYSLRGLPKNNPRASWSIGEPLKTRLSTGDYAQDGRGEHTVRANITTLWEITRHDQRRLEIRDNVSTSISITTNDGEIARWTMDIAAVATAPGCGLHAQVKEPWFVEGFDIPRMPIFIPTLGAVLEFVLGELFQQAWTQRVTSHTSTANWRALQQRAWLRWLDWQQEVVRTSAVSPWLDIKAGRCDGLDNHDG